MIFEHHAGLGNLRVVDHGVDFAIGFHSFCNHVLNRRFVRTVRRDGKYACPVRLKLFLRLEKRGFRSARDDELRPRLCISGGNSEADASAAARNDNYLVLYVHK